MELQDKSRDVNTFTLAHSSAEARNFQLQGRLLVVTGRGHQSLASSLHEGCTAAHGGFDMETEMRTSPMLQAAKLSVLRPRPASLALRRAKRQGTTERSAENVRLRRPAVWIECFGECLSVMETVEHD